jgi:hypothetical protein
MILTRPAAALVTATLAGLLHPAPAALAGGDPTPEEGPRIEAASRGLGFERWDDIEFEDGVWEVDDAHAVDGVEYDLKLRPDTFEVLEREEDRVSGPRGDPAVARRSYLVEGRDLWLKRSRPSSVS